MSEQATTTPVTGEVSTTPAEVTTPEVKAPEADSGAYAKLAKQQAKLVAEQKEFKAKQAALEAEKAQIQSNAKRLAEFEQLLQQNPIKALEQLGLDYNKATEYYMNNGTAPIEDQVKAQVQEQLRAHEEAQRQAEAEAAKAQYAEITNEFKSTISEFVSENKDKYELINLDPELYTQWVYETIDEHYNTVGGEPMSISDAADKVEKHLEGLAERWLNTNKLKAKVNPPVKEEAPEPKAKAELKQYIQGRSSQGQWVSDKQKTRTLTNSVPAAQAQSPTKYLSERERVQNAINKLKAGQI